MGAYPGREFRMSNLVKYVSGSRKHTLKERHAIRKSVLRALDALVESGSVLKSPPSAVRGGYVKYRWR
jgi:hypothetical protein